MREQLDLPTIKAMQNEWGKHPPTHHLVAAYMGRKPVRSGKVEVATLDNIIEEFSGMLSGNPTKVTAPQ